MREKEKETKYEDGKSLSPSPKPWSQLMGSVLLFEKLGGGSEYTLCVS